MKNSRINENKYIAWGITAFLVICAALLVTYLIFNFSNFLSGISWFFHILTPIIDGIALAYLLTPILNVVETRWVGYLFSKTKLELTYKRKKHIRLLSILITMLIVIFALSIFFRIIIPQLILSIQSIIFQFPRYLNNLETFFTNLINNNPELENTVDSVFDMYSTQITDYVQNGTLPQINNLVKTLSQSIINFIKATFNMIIGLIISIYLMTTKETIAGQAKKIVYALYDTKEANKLIAGVRYTHKTFIGFVGGKIVDSLIIGIITFIVTKIVGTPYPVLVSVIVGVTNIIPFFGPYIGAIPSALLILMVNPIQCLYFIIIILIIQQIDGNIIGPKILGDSTGLSSFWVIFAITLFGGLFGVAGMVLGVPTFAVIYALIKYSINRKLRHKGLPYDTVSYIKVGSIDKDGTFNDYVPVKGKSFLQFIGIQKSRTNRSEILPDDEDEIEVSKENEDSEENTISEDKIEI